MAAINYLDFDLLIERAEAGYRARVLRCPAVPTTGEFTLPFSDLELENFLLRIGRPRRDVRRLESPKMELAKEFGRRLFEATFGDEVRGCLRRSLDEANRQGQGLRVRLHLSGVPQLADLPWEFLYDSSLNRFFVLSAKTPLVRYLDLPEQIQPLVVRPPIKILVMISTPSDFPQLDVDQEWARLGEALTDLQRRNLVAAERLEEATLPCLQRRLRRGEYHIFHFIGHGTFDERAQDGVLLLEEEAGRGRPVSGQDLGTLLHDHWPLRLALLNACEGARTSRSDPFAGAAQSLVQQGLPAVIAMQFEISDQAAITFAHEFYAAVADGYPVDAALAEARKGIFARGGDLEWGTPVLYMRAADGRIFDVASAAPPAKPAGEIAQPAAGERDAEKGQRLADQYTQALAFFYTERWDKAIELFQEILAQQASYEDTAGKLAEAIRQRELAEHYAAGKTAYAVQVWPAAVEHLEAVLALDAGYRDAGTLLAEARRQKGLADLYTEARHLSQGQAWQAVVKVFERIAAVDAAYPDPENLLTTARSRLQAAEQERRLAALYGQGVRLMDAGQWAEAQRQFEEIQRLTTGYRETQALLTLARQKLAERQAAEQRQARLADLYQQATARLAKRDWAGACALLSQIQQLEPGYRDVLAKLVEAQRQKELAEQPPPAVRPGKPTALPEQARPGKPTALPEEIKPRGKPKDLPR
jgi:hypothetical protein